MKCTAIQLPGGTAIACTRGNSKALKKRCHACGAPAPFLCDGKRPRKKSGTCDLPLCKRHTRQVPAGKGETFDLCSSCDMNRDLVERELKERQRKAEAAARQLDLFKGGT